MNMGCLKASKKSGAVSFLGLNLHPVSADEVHEFIGKVIRDRQKAIVLHLNIYGVNLALELKWMKDFFNESQLVFCDGDGVRWGTRLLGLPVPPKITYDRWIWQLADFCEKKHFRLFFLGGKPSVASLAVERLREKYPGLEVVGVRHGYFEKEGSENEDIIAEINRQKPDILIVGLGMPIQEKWLMDNWEKIDANIFLTGGAVFDYASGKAKRAPRWMIRLQLEWLFRLLQEPRRLFLRYAIGIPYFLFRVILEKLR